MLCIGINSMRMIAFSGIDGSGKGTQISMVERFFRKKNIKFKTIWARGSWTPGIELVKKLVRRDRGFSEEEKARYREEARRNPVKQKIILILSILDLYWLLGIYYRLVSWCGKVVICDRYIWDTLADFKVNFKRYDVERWFLWRLLIKIIPKPNPSFMLMISADKSIERGLIKQEAYMESMDVKREKVKVYEELVKQGKWSHVIDGDGSIEDIATTIRKALAHENR